MAQAGTQVFISYHRADVDAAEQVRTRLVANEVTTWMDQYDIPAGAYWPDEIDKGLNQADFVVGLLSPDAVDSRNVKNEWDWALQNDKHLILLMVRPCVVPHRYVSINFIDATGEDVGAALETLARTPGLRSAAATIAVPHTRYARSGSLNVAYQVFGDGALDLVFVPGYISHVEQIWKYPACSAFLERFGTFARILMFDKRGTGMSDRATGIPTLEERMDDIRAVMNAAGSEKAVMFGLSEGVPLSVLFGATHPDRTHGLILYGGSATYVQQPDYPWGRPLEEYQRGIDEDEATLFERWGAVEYGREIVRKFAPSAAHDDALVTWFNDLRRLGASPGAAIALERMNMDVDVRGILSSIRVPTLVANRVGDRGAKIGEARYLAERIPGAELAELPGDDHFPFVGDQEPFFAAIGPFIAGLGGSAAGTVEPEPVLATVVCLTEEGADLAATDGAVSRDIQRFRGRLVTAPNGRTLFVFDGPARALRYAHAVAGSSERDGAAIRGGVQTGEVILDERTVKGPAVKIATRLAALAAPGQLLATSTVQDLVAGSGIRFGPIPQAVTETLTDMPPVLAVDRDSLA